MNRMLDTNICIYLIKKHPSQIIARFKKCNVQDICISSIVLSELEFGVYNSEHVTKNSIALTKFLIPFDLVGFDDVAAKKYGQIRAIMERKGLVIGPYDLLIAAHALSLNLVLVTNNVREFSRVPDLRVENWV